jgi:hypothetical protein
MGTDGKRSRLLLRGLHWYSSQAGTELRRRPTDIVLLAACLLGLLLLAPSAPGPTPSTERQQCRACRAVLSSSRSATP